MKTEEMTERFLQKTYRIIDVLPERVSEDRASQYFVFDDYLRNEDNIKDLHKRFIRLFLKLECYYEMSVSYDLETYEKDPAPDELADRILDLHQSDRLRVFLSDLMMIDYDASDSNMTVYGEDAQRPDLLKELVLSEGLFLWRPEDQ
jgi:hypothetical protein